MKQSTDTKVAYIVDGLVKASEAEATAETDAYKDKNYVTDAELVVVGNTSGTNTGNQTLPTLTSLGALAANTAITAGTNTKITYDVDSLVTAG